MKVLSFLLLILSCSVTNQQVTGKVLYIEPHIYSGRLGHHLAFSYKQKAWIKDLNSHDSIAVVFTYKHHRGNDMATKIDLNNIYTFSLTKMDIINKPITTNTPEADSILSMPIRQLIHDSLQVKSKTFWQVDDLKL